MDVSAIGEQAALLQHEWQAGPRWAGITRHYSAQDVIRLRGRAAGEHALARRGASRLWGLLHGQGAVAALGAVPGNEAQLPGAGLQAIYLPGGQAADGNLAGHEDPGQSPYPASPVTQMVRRVNDAQLARTRPAGPGSPATASCPRGGDWPRSWPTPAVRRRRSS